MARKKHKNPLIAWWFNYSYKHTSLAIVLVILFILLLDTAVISAALGFIEGLGYIGIFIAGMLSVSFFTAVPAIVILIDMAGVYDPFALAIVAGAGAMVGDWLTLFFFQERIAEELHPLIKRLRLHRLVQKLQHRYTRWILFVLGALLVFTPSPDELGLALLGISRFSKIYLLAVCFALNVLGFLGLVGVVRLLT